MRARLILSSNPTKDDHHKEWIRPIRPQPQKPKAEKKTEEVEFSFDGELLLVEGCEPLHV